MSGDEPLTSSCDDIPVNNIDRHVGARLRARRMLIQMSETWLADFLGMSEEHLARIEEGRARIGYEDLLRAASVIGVPERYFYQSFKGGNAPAPPEDKGPSWIRDVDRWFRDHVSPHEGLFLSVAKRLIGNLDAARDLVHDAYAAVLSDERWRTVDNPKAYVHRTVANLALNLIKHKKIVPMEQYAETELMGLMDAAPDAYQAVADRERLAVVLEALNKLPPQTRQVFVLRRIEDMAPRDIAACLAISVSTVEWHLAQGLAALNRHLETHRKSVDLKVWLANRQHVDSQVAVKKDKP